MQIVTAQQIRSVLDWAGVLDALREGHAGARPIGDSYFVGDAGFGLFSRGVILPGKGAGFKVASLCPANQFASPPRPTEQSAFLVVDEHSRNIVAMLDGPEITRWKTAADSALAATKLSREDSEVLLVLGAGPVALALAEAYLHIRPSLREVLLWNRTLSKLDEMRVALERRDVRVRVVEDLDDAVARADIVTAATGAATPVIRGKLVRPGTHVDLVGGYRPDMQEADCDALKGARIFVDDRENASVSGDILIPMQAQVIQAQQIEADLFELCQDTGFHRGAGDRTVYKNAGGAYLDLLVSQYVVERLKSS
ncbi:ornithine cyclodeaminase [Caballeronia sp. LZ034LL]|uniref:ornithine cyclodeaminase family protein n=1 Tax=Caballeronia sp. LZ034LL TaxID=3038567 RepID=UPI00285737FC|nr:ornithine cyclodeaminase [Caballeronia sp. LZ034LL]MDR5836223.1 ornithine cyclodeaminase [Caballeronia sp. LZ034LL]